MELIDESDLEANNRYTKQSLYDQEMFDSQIVRPYLSICIDSSIK